MRWRWLVVVRRPPDPIREPTREANLDVVAKHLAVALGAALAETLAALATSRHICRVCFWLVSEAEAGPSRGQATGSKGSEGWSRRQLRALPPLAGPSAPSTATDARSLRSFDPEPSYHVPTRFLAAQSAASSLPTNLIGVPLVPTLLAQRGADDDATGGLVCLLSYATCMGKSTQRARQATRQRRHMGHNPQTASTNRCWHCFIPSRRLVV